MGGLPSGTVTFVFTDIEGSTRLLQELGDRYRDLLAAHNTLLREAFAAHGGVEIRTEGDSFFVVFARATDAVAAAIDAQRALGAHSWPADARVRVRMGMHTGEAEAVGNDYVGIAVHQAARISTAGHGGQVLLSQTTRDLTAGALPDGANLRDLGEHRLKDLAKAERVFQLAHPDLADDFPPVRTIETLPNNLPLQLTTFVGREREIDECVGRLSETRLLTLTGPGGCGKTRLALQVAAEVLERYPHGVWIADLATIVDPEQVPHGVATALGVAEEAGRPIADSLQDHLSSRTLLLLLDNCEHLVRPCGDLAERLLRSCPGLAILATTREALGIAGETAWRVPSLSLPGGNGAPAVEMLVAFEAARLFLERARAADPSFVPSEHDVAPIVQICRRLDGIPLAIELSAPWVKALSPAQIASRLDDQFRILTGGSRTALERQQTLRASVDWSYQLIEEPERALLRRLSVFVGGCTLEAAEAVCAGEGVEPPDVLPLLLRLVDKSLVVADRQAGVARYRLLETIRQYAREKLHDLGEGSPSRVAHRDFFLALAEEAEPGLRGPDQGAWLDRLEAEHDNVRAALEWSISEPDPAAAVRLAGAFWRFWDVRGHWTEGRRWLEHALGLGTAPIESRANALLGAGVLAGYLDDDAANDAYLGEALSSARATGRRDVEAYALRWMASASRVPREELRALLEESAAIFREMGDRHAAAEAVLTVVSVAMQDHDPDRARGLVEEALAIWRDLGHTRGIAECLDTLGMLAWFQGDFRAVRVLAEESLPLRTQMGDQLSVVPKIWLGWAAWGLGDFDAARSSFRENIPVLRELGERRMQAALVGGIAFVDLVAGETQSARTLLQESIDALDPFASGFGPYAYNLSAMGWAMRSLGEPVAARDWLTRALETFDSRKRYHGAGWTLNGLAWLDLDEGDVAGAHAKHAHALDLERAIGDRLGIVFSLEGMAGVALPGEPARAARLLGAAEAIRAEIGSPVDLAAGADRERVAAGARAALGDAAFDEAFARGRAMSIEEATADALGEERARA